ncbi:hypothetical protein TIFTF001_025553 [Ficus carica]|uniref:Isopenicillin N synthase-like Fe(2+) 2OG dioxygenase domain-containing protein n=1 Tax=Ficus carica TaxID=3494 RepID=A0AA88ANX9_FICCA|nr:hypothetical protein TIFTF001_025553 [Ficus carica]
MLFSNDPDQRCKALHYLNHVSQNYGCFPRFRECTLKGISDFFDPTEVKDRRLYEGKNPMDRIRWGLSSSLEENREHLKVVVHPQFHCPPKPAHFSVALEEYSKRLREVELGLAKAMSRALGYDECFIEKALNLESGFDVFVTNHNYPPNFKSEGSMGLADHTDPGLFVSLIQDVNGGLQVLYHNGQWLEVHAP